MPVFRPPNVSRRKFLKLGSAAVAAAVAGCSGDEEGTPQRITSSTKTGVETEGFTTRTPFTTTIPTETQSETVTETQSDATETQSETATEIPQESSLVEIVVEDPDQILESLGEESVDQGSLGQHEEKYTLNMDSEERKELYEADVFRFIREETWEELKSRTENRHDPSNYQQTINFLAAGMDNVGIDKENYSLEQIATLHSAVGRLGLLEMAGREINESRIGFSPHINRFSYATEHTDTPYAVINFAEHYDRESNSHFTRIYTAWGTWHPADIDDSGLFDNEGAISESDKDTNPVVGPSEIDQLLAELNGPPGTLDVTPRQIQGMFRDELVGFTNWVDVKEELDYEWDRSIDATDNINTATDTPSESTPTPVPEGELPDLQIAAHTNFMENYRQATVDSDLDKQQAKFALSDTITDYVLNGNEEDVYGILVGGAVEDPTIIKATYEEMDFFESVRDLEADRNYSLDELAQEYRESGEIPTIAS